jgi:hypothetical protein
LVWQTTRPPAAEAVADSFWISPTLSVHADFVWLSPTTVTVMGWTGSYWPALGSDHGSFTAPPDEYCTWPPWLTVMVADPGPLAEVTETDTDSVRTVVGGATDDVVVTCSTVEDDPEPVPVLAFLAALEHPVTRIITATLGPTQARRPTDSDVTPSHLIPRSGPSSDLSSSATEGALAALILVALAVGIGTLTSWCRQ